MPTLGTQQINIGPLELGLSLVTALPAAGNASTTGILDLQAIAPNSDAQRLGRIAIVVPNIPGNTAGAGVTVALQAAPPSLVAGSTSVAPNTNTPGAFITPAVAQTLTVPAVAVTGSLATIYYMTLAIDPATGSPYEFYQFVITTPAQVTPAGENITVAWMYA